MVAVAPSNEIFVHRFLEVVGLLHLLEESRFLTNADRMENRDTLVEIINAVTETRSVDHWIEVINKGGCPCGRVMNLGEVFSDPQVLSQEMVLEVDHPGHGMVKMTGFPVKLSETPPKLHRPAPRLGEHTEEVLGALRKRSGE
jgi:crotonobetainyl-CoA:carnitine CoA-transferase CaiB-like acyl-CoA transferase